MPLGHRKPPNVISCLPDPSIIVLVLPAKICVPASVHTRARVRRFKHVPWLRAAGNHETRRSFAAKPLHQYLSGVQTNATSQQRDFQRAALILASPQLILSRVSFAGGKLLGSLKGRGAGHVWHLAPGLPDSECLRDAGMRFSMHGTIAEGCSTCPPKYASS